MITGEIIGCKSLELKRCLIIYPSVFLFLILFAEIRSIFLIKIMYDQ